MKTFKEFLPEAEPEDRAAMHLVASYHPLKNLKAKQAAFAKADNK